MKKQYIILTLLAVLVFAASSSAQFLGQMSPASVIPTGSSKIDSYLMVGENSIGVAGQFRYGFSQFVEGRARLGFIDPEYGDMNVILGGDLKYLIMPYDEQKNKFDMALGGGFEYTKLGGTSFLGITGSVLGSIPMQLENNKSITPYARVGLRVQRVSIDDQNINTGAGTVTVEGGSDTKLKIGANIGAEFSVIDLTDFMAEIQIDDEFGFFFGINLFEF
ncbi:MAG: hypothetical protein R3F48_09330 [Candidatus Zixiibacteriota bacterium]